MIYLSPVRVWSWLGEAPGDQIIPLAAATELSLLYADSQPWIRACEQLAGIAMGHPVIWEWVEGEFYSVLKDHSGTAQRIKCGVWVGTRLAMCNEWTLTPVLFLCPPYYSFVVVYLFFCFEATLSRAQGLLVAMYSELVSFKASDPPTALWLWSHCFPVSLIPLSLTWTLPHS